MSAWGWSCWGAGMLGMWLMAPSLFPQVPTGEPGQVSALHPLPVLTDNLTGPPLTHPTDAMDPWSPVLPKCWGWSVGAGSQHLSLQHLPGTHSGEGTVPLVACPAAAAARDSDGQTRHV